jgi:hypothetical protein
MAYCGLINNDLSDSIPLSAFIASKSDPDTLMYHEAMMAFDKADFCEATEVEIKWLEL